MAVDLWLQVLSVSPQEAYTGPWGPLPWPGADLHLRWKDPPLQVNFVSTCTGNDIFENCEPTNSAIKPSGGFIYGSEGVDDDNHTFGDSSRDAELFGYTGAGPWPVIMVCGIESARLKGDGCAITGISSREARAYGIFQISEWGGNNYKLRACLYQQIPHPKGHECYGPQVDFNAILTSWKKLYIKRAEMKGNADDFPTLLPGYPHIDYDDPGPYSLITEVTGIGHLFGPFDDGFIELAWQDALQTNTAYARNAGPIPKSDFTYSTQNCAGENNLPLNMNETPYADCHTIFHNPASSDYPFEVSHTGQLLGANFVGEDPLYGQEPYFEFEKDPVTQECRAMTRYSATYGESSGHDDLSGGHSHYLNIALHSFVAEGFYTFYNQMLHGTAVPPRPSVWCPYGIDPTASPPIKDFPEADIPRWKLFTAIHEVGHIIGYGNFPDDVNLCSGGATVMKYPPFPAEGGDAPTLFYFCENQINNSIYGLRVATELK